MYTAAASQYAPNPKARSTGAMGKKTTEGAAVIACVATLITATAIATRFSMIRVKISRSTAKTALKCAQYPKTSWFSSEGST
jgi:hypothetical protein